MSSAKMRLKLRVKRLQEMYKQLGRDPNAKGKVPMIDNPYRIRNKVID
jgi:hypothetical protein